MSKPKKNENRKMPVQYGRALIQPASIDVEKREVDVVFATEAEVERFGWEEDYAEVLVCEQSAIRLGRADAGLPVLDSHNAYSIEHQLGVSIRVWINEAREVCARLRFSSTNKAADLFQDIEDGIIKSISVGYRVFKFEKEDRPGQLPLYRATDWEPYEISFVPIPADFKSTVRANTGEHSVEIINIRTINTNTTMSKTKKRSTETGKTTKWTVADGPVKKGDTVDTGEVKGIALDDGEDGDEITLSLIEEGAGADPEVAAAAEDAAAAAGEAASAATEAAAAAEDAAAAASEAAAAATEAAGGASDEEGARRISEIRKMVRAAGLTDSYALALAETKLTVDQCRKAVIIRMEKKQGKVNGSHVITVGAESGSKRRAAATEHILHRVMPSKFGMTEGARYFHGTSLVEMAKEILQDAGVNTRGLSKNEIADFVFGKRAHGTSDFPLLFEGVINKMLRAQYEFVQEQWGRIARRTSVSDFRAKGLYQVGSINGMKKVAEGGEIKYTTLVESKQSIRVESYAEGIALTRQAFINDDLGAFAIIPTHFVKDWDELQGNNVWGLLIDNVKMGDGKSLFHADHNNLLTGAASALSETSLGNARKTMMRQKGIDGRLIRVLPKFLVVPPELEIPARKLITETTPAKSDDVNPFAKAFEVIVEPRLEDPTAWYLAADPNAVDGLYYAYLEGNEQLRVNTEHKFDTDTMNYAVRGDFGAAAIDHRGLLKANGK